MQNLDIRERSPDTVILPKRSAIPGRSVCAALAFALAVFSAVWNAAAVAQVFPAKPMKIVVGFNPGGPPDIAARIVAQKLSEGMGQQVVVENRPGAGGTIGAAAVANATPDGYTVLLATTGVLAAAPSLFPNPGYDPRKSFEPIGMIGIADFVLVINPSLQATTLKEFIELARAKPGQLNYGSAGNGTPPHIVAEMFKVLVEVNLVHVPYKGTAAAMTALLAGDVQVFFDQLAPLLPHIRAGKMRAVAVASAKRHPQLPGVPTAAEGGLPGFEASAWTGLVAPRGTPANVIAKLNAETLKALATKEVRDILANQGTEPAGNSPEEFAALIDKDIEKWSRAVKASGAKID